MNTEFPSGELDRIIAEIYLRSAETLTAEQKLDEDLGGDSLTVVELVMAIERKMDVKLPDRGIGKIKTVGELRELVRERWETRKIIAS